MVPLSLLLLYLLLLHHHHHHHRLADANTFVYAGCSPAKADPSTPFLSNLNALLSSLVSASSLSSYSGFSNGTSTPSAAFGLYQCRIDLSLADCSSCVQSAASQLPLLCGASFTASLQLDGCLVRYSADDFLGKRDTSLVYKRCGEATAGSVEFFRRRDDVLGDLRNGVGFRVSSSGGVHGFGQCLGDVGPDDCKACLSEAVARLKDACGSALAADVYLGQCYARYWASGYYNVNSPSDSADDDMGKTVAIIVGVLAGVAVLVVFLSFLRKALA